LALELVDEAPLGEGEGDVESLWSADEDLLVGVTVGLGFLLPDSIVDPPWMGSLEIYWV